MKKARLLLACLAVFSLTGCDLASMFGKKSEEKQDTPTES